MSDCCETHSRPPRKYRCPLNGHEYSAVPVKTVLHHLTRPWDWYCSQGEMPAETGYYFCSDDDCDVVYFGQDDSVIVKSQIRTRIGAKERNADRPVCYCFGISFGAAKENPALIEFVRNCTRQGLCSCTTRNPSGRCCLRDFA